MSDCTASIKVVNAKFYVGRYKLIELRDGQEPCQVLLAKRMHG